MYDTIAMQIPLSLITYHLDHSQENLYVYVFCLGF